MLLLSQDQYDVIDKHTQSGLDLMERYIKFVKERTDIEQNYAKQLRWTWTFIEICTLIVPLLYVNNNLPIIVFLLCNRNLTKKYNKRGNKDDQDCK